MTTADLIEYYKNLLIVQYERNTKARGTIAAYVSEALADQIISKVGDAFNFRPSGDFGSDAAQGVQLETIAKYRGLTRNAYGLSRTLSSWKMPIYGDAGADTALGLPVYGNLAPNDIWLTYDLGNSALYVLTDSELSRLLQLRAQSQSALLSVAQVDDIIYSIFGNNVGFFEGGMQVTYADLLSDTGVLFDIAVLTQSLPRPAGVKITSERLPALSNYFGYQYYGIATDPTFIGYSLYGTPTLGSFMRYL